MTAPDAARPAETTTLIEMIEAAYHEGAYDANGGAGDWANSTARKAIEDPSNIIGRLALAAPALLAALEELIAEWCDDADDPFWNAARAAVAIAKGETP